MTCYLCKEKFNENEKKSKKVKEHRHFTVKY